VAIQGSLDEASLPDVVQLLALGRKTGCLSLTEGTLNGEIYLDAGRVCYAFVASRRDRVGDMLVRTGRITQQQLSDAIAAHQQGNKRVSDILLESGQVQHAELLRFMQRQVEEAVYFMFTWRTGSFTFQSSIRPKHQTLLVSVDPEGLLLEGARRVDEWSVIQKKISSFDLVYRLDREHLNATDVTLDDDQKHLLPLIDGSRDVTGIIELSGLSEFDVGKALFGLIAAGFAQVVERRTITRHLDYRELLAYVVREAEFADPEQRRAAARHIADCVSCTERLKTIHVRRSSTMTAVADEVSPARPAVPAAPAAPAVPPTPVTPPKFQAKADRRHDERRSGEERRSDERRHGERRRVRSAEWERPGVDRRGGGDRRGGERRVVDRRLGAGAPAIALVRDPAAARRTTGPRQVHAPESTRSARRRLDRSARPATPEERAPDAAPAASAAPAAPAAPAPPATAAAPAPEPAAPTAGDLITDGTRRPVPGAVTRNPRPGEHRPGTRSKDLQWLLSPDEADDLLRTSWTALPQPPKPGTQPAAEAPAAAPPPPAPVAPVKAPSVTTPAEPQVATAAPVPAPVERPAPQVKPAIAAPARAGLSPRLRVLAAVAVILAAVGLGWVTAPLLQSGRGVEPAVTPPAQAAPAEPTAPPREEVAAAVPVSPPVRQDAAPDQRAATPEVRAPATRPAPPPERRPATVAPAPVPAAPAVGSVRGVVRDAATGAPLAGVRIAVAGTSLSALTDAAGMFVITDVTPGSVSLAASAGDRPAASHDVVVQAGGIAQAEFSLEPAPPPAAPPAVPVAPVAPVVPAEADEELAAGGWVSSDLASAAGTLGIPLAVIPGLYMESVSVPESGGRPRVRVAQLTASGQRIVLTQTRAGAPVPGTPRVTALRIIPASQTYPLTTGTASFGNLLVTAKAAMPGDALRALLATLVVAGSD
jgi:Domain of unknown function (DUF4388)/Carboxypeptidase regulatory-like domain